MSERDLRRTGEALLARLDERVRTLERKRATLTTEVINTPEGRAGRDGRDGVNGLNGLNGTDGGIGPAGPAATVEIFDEGVSLGTFETIDFVGDCVAATLVGTAATVTVACSAGSSSRSFAFFMG